MCFGLFWITFRTQIIIETYCAFIYYSIDIVNTTIVVLSTIYCTGIGIGIGISIGIGIVHIYIYVSRCSSSIFAKNAAPSNTCCTSFSTEEPITLRFRMSNSPSAASVPGTGVASSS